MDRLFWIAARKVWSGWKGSLIIVTPKTVVRWHRAGFRLYWRWISRTMQQVGRKRISNEARELIFRMAMERLFRTTRLRAISFLTETENMGWKCLPLSAL
jgi:hypothetical protein